MILICVHLQYTCQQNHYNIMLNIYEFVYEQVVDECDQTSMTTTCSTASMKTENDENGHTHAFVLSLSSDSDASDSDSGTFMLLLFLMN